MFCCPKILESGQNNHNSAQVDGFFSSIKTNKIDLPWGNINAFLVS